MEAPTTTDEQNVVYNGWLHSALVMGTIAFGADGTIIWAKLNYPGSWNDADTFCGCHDKLVDLQYTLKEYGILADAAFPVSQEIQNKIVTSLKKGDLQRAIAAGATQEEVIAIHNAIVSIQQAAEWGMGAVEKVYRHLLLCLPFNPVVRALRLANIHRLYNF